MKNLNVLIVTTSHDQLGNTGEKTGVWLEELAGPYYQYLDHGASITIASAKGGNVPLDPKSELEEWQTAFTRRFSEDEKALASIKNTKSIAEVNPSEFDILFFPGGHGPMWDLGDNKDVARLINAFDKKDKPIGLVCHGVVALKGVKTINGDAFSKGKRITSFTNSEEEAVGLTDVVPFLLEDVLIEEGAIYVKEQDWYDFVVEDGNLITGQNPQSSVSAAQKTIELVSDIDDANRVRIATDFFNAYKNQDLAKAAALASENGTFRYIPLGENGKGKIKGTERTTWQGIASALINSFPDLSNDVKNISIDNQGNAIVQVFIGGTQEKEILGIPSKGKYYNVEHLFLLNINNKGLIEEITCYWDNWDWFQQIGYNPS
ncbi:DJ-1/PfpI family protein [uncultured Dokdonia sp.]|uniref:DJ-1/PfpI family protein n=1 Tax=uncultured Dokdonia sp. TaxID=575653 RepID=UPI0026325DE0|nr:DJ-1/PfpI family protein [uncultured Dokdonia sp.]